MSGKYVRYSLEYKREALLRMESCKNVSALARELGIRRTDLNTWRSAFRLRGDEGLKPRPVKARTAPRGLAAPQEVMAPPLMSLQQRVAELERLLGVKQLEVDFFKRTFAHVRGAMQTATDGGETESTKASGQDSRSKDRD